MRISDWSSDVCSSDLPQAQRLDQLGRAFLAMILGDGAAGHAVLDVDIAQARIAFAARPIVHVVEEFAAARASARRRDGSDHAAALHQRGKDAEAGAMEMPGAEIGNETCREGGVPSV